SFQDVQDGLRDLLRAHAGDSRTGSTAAKRRVRHAWENSAHLYAELAKLVGQGCAQAANRELGRIVARRVGVARFAGHGRDIDNVSLPLSFHDRNYLSYAVKEP